MGQPVAPDATKDIAVDLVAPQAPGTYTGVWQMNTAGTRFPETIYVKVTVSGPPTPVPSPTSPPPSGLPTIQYFTANPGSIQGGQ